jgi:hypothetical protein
MTVLHPAPRPPAPPATAPRRAGPSSVRSAWARRHEAIDGRWALAVGGAWVGMFFVEPFLVPAPAEAGPAPWWDVALGVVWLALLGAVVAGCLFRSRFGILASAVGVVMTVPLVVACPVSGHHEWATWWAVDLALWLAIGATTIEALRRATPPADGGRASVR